MIKFLCLTFFTILMSVGVQAAPPDVIYLNSVQDKVLNEENVSDFILGESGVVEVKRVGQTIQINPIALVGETYLILLKRDGTSHNYIIQVNNGRQSSISEKTSKLVSGTLAGSTGFSNQLDSQNKNPYGLSLDTRIRTSENSSFNFGLEQYSDPNGKSNSDLYYVSEQYYDKYLSWGQFVEPTASLPFYISNNMRGFTLGKRNNSLDMGIWTANQYENRKENPENHAQGVFLYSSYLDIPYKVTLENSRDRYIPMASVSLNTYGIINNLGYSFLDDKYLFRYYGVRNFNEGSSDFNFRSINGYFYSAPNGSYGLFDQNNISYRTVGTNIGFSNQDRVDLDVKKDIDFLPGVIATTFGFEENSTDGNINDHYNGFFGYGHYDKVTLSGNVDYSMTNIYGLVSQTFSYAPRLSLFFIGNKNKGISIRNEYTSTLNRDYLGNLTQAYSNIVGLYRNTRQYYYGVFGGNSSFNNTEISQNSRILGAEFDYLLHDNTSIRLSGQNTTGQNGSSVNEATLQLRTVYKKDLVIYTRINYVERKDVENNFMQTSLIGTAGFSWNFGFGEGNVYSKITDNLRTISGHAFNDLNFNGIKDDNEPYIQGVDLSIVKIGDNTATTDSQGKFKFSGFSPNDSIAIDVNSSKYYSSKTLVFNMTKSYELDVSLYEGVSKKVRVVDQKNNPILISQISFSCEKNSLLLKKEVYSDYTQVQFPSDKIDCSPEVSTTADSGIIIEKVDSSSDSMTVHINVLPKMALFEFTKKVVPFSINGKKITSKTNQVVETIAPFEGVLDVKLPKNCSIEPQNFEISYNKLKNQNFYKIFCF